MKKLTTFLLLSLFSFAIILNSQTTEVVQEFGDIKIHMESDPSGGGTILNMEGTGDFDKKLWRLVFDKNELTPPDGPIERAWEVGTLAGFGVDKNFFGIGRWSFILDFIVSEIGFVMDDETLFTGIGELTPNARLHVFNNDDFGSSEIPATLVGEYPGSSFDYGYLTVDQPDTDDNTNIARFRDDGLTQVWIQRNAAAYQLQVFGDALASGGIWQNSDRRLKSDITDLDFGLEGLRKLRPTSYLFDRTPEWNKHLPEEMQFGLIAQELMAVYPNLVRESNQLTEEGEILGTIHSINYTGLIPVLISSIQELDQKLREKNDETSNLYDRIERLEKLVDQLTKK